jgi:L-asparagine transporter-like permease
MTGFESVAKGSEEAQAGFDPRNFTKAIYAALFAGLLFYVIIIAVVTYVYPWQQIVSGHVRTEVAFERTFGSHKIAQLILFGAFLSLLKIFNGNFVAATRDALRDRAPQSRAPGARPRARDDGDAGGGDHADGGLTAAAAMFGDAILVPITEVGSLAVGVGWMSACAAYLARRRRDRYPNESAAIAWVGVAVSAANRPDEDRSRRARQLHARRVDRVCGLVSVRAALLARPAPLETAPAPATRSRPAAGRRESRRHRSRPSSAPR